MIQISPLFRRCFVGLALCVPSHGSGDYNDDAWSYAMEEATPEAKKNVYIREDFWSGSSKAGSVQSSVAQLFRGNTYWFWIGAVPEDTRIAIEVRDAGGRIVPNASARSVAGRAAICIKPPRTGAYTVRVQYASATESLVDWVMAYGYE